MNQQAPVCFLIHFSRKKRKKNLTLCPDRARLTVPRAQEAVGSNADAD